MTLTPVRLTPRNLPGPDSDGSTPPPPPPGVQGAGHLVSGGGLVAEIDGTRGLVRLRAHALEYVIRTRVAQMDPEGTIETTVDAGSWRRRIPLAGDRTLMEHGLLVDGIEAAVLAWVLESPAAEGNEEGDDQPQTSVHLVVGDSDPRNELHLGAGAEPVAVALLPADPPPDPERIRRYLQPLKARHLQRASRFRDEEGDTGGVQVRWEFSSEPSSLDLNPARRRLDAALSDPSSATLVLGTEAAEGGPGRGSRPRIRLLATPDPTPGIHPAQIAPEVAPSVRAEVGIALLLLGWHRAARLQLEALAREPEAAPAGLLHLATLWAGWTGRPSELLEFESALKGAARTLQPGARNPAGAAWPPPARLVHDLADALEPTGHEEWRTALQVRSALLRPGSGSFRLPPLTAFPPSSAGFTGTDGTVRAARLVRSWIMGQLGVHAEAAWGRLALRPILGDRHPGEAPPPPPLELLEATAIRVGDTRIGLHCRREEGRYTFRLAQTHGRVPLNLIFEPWLPLRKVSEIRLADERVDLDVEPEGPGVRVRLQFPLDPERRLIIDGET